MTKKFLLTTALMMMLGSFGSMSARAQDAKLTDAQKAEVEKLVHDYIMGHGDVIMEAVDTYRQKAEVESNKAFDEKIKENADELYKNADVPFAGNKDGDVVLVEFFDYNCGYCKLAYKDVQALIEEDKKLKVVLFDIPILSEASGTAARYALAAHKQGKYWEFHQELMRNGANTPDQIQNAGKALNLDMDKLKADAESAEIRESIEKHLELAREVGISGTPAFVINDQALRGHYGLDALKKAIEDARASKQ